MGRVLFLRHATSKGTYQTNTMHNPLLRVFSGKFYAYTYVYTKVYSRSPDPGS